MARTDSTPRPRAIPADVWALAAVMVVGATLRFATIASQSYWIDEANTVHELHLSFGALLHALRVNESTPPLYYVLAWLWAKVFGTSEAGLRSLSALFGTAAIPIAYLCGRELVSRWTGVVAAGLLAVNPFMLWYSQEARAYMLFGALCGLSFLYFARSLREPSTRNLAWWAVTSALALGTHFFAAFLVAAEGLWLLLVVRRRAMLLAAGAVAAVQAALLPLAISDTSHPLQGWIKQFPLSVRIKQVPVDFGMSTLYQSSLVTHALVATIALAAILAVCVTLGGGHEHRRGAALSASLAAAVILVPLLLAVLGRDYFVARNLMPAWIPLAVLTAAACTAPRTLPLGAALGTVLIAVFVYAGIKIDRSPQYERPNWRGVAAALGSGASPRAIALYDGRFAAEPLAVYLRGVPWTQAASAPVTVGEIDVVGNTWQTPASPLPAGVRLLSSKPVDSILVDRFAVQPAWHQTPAAIGALATALLGPASPAPAVLIQGAGRAR